MIGGAGDSLSESIITSGEGELGAHHAASALTPDFSSSEESPVRAMGERNLERSGHERERVEWPLAGLRTCQQLM